MTDAPSGPVLTIGPGICGCRAVHGARTRWSSALPRAAAGSCAVGGAGGVCCAAGGDVPLPGRAPPACSMMARAARRGGSLSIGAGAGIAGGPVHVDGFSAPTCAPVGAASGEPPWATAGGGTDVSMTCPGGSGSSAAVLGVPLFEHFSEGGAVFAPDTGPLRRVLRIGGHQTGGKVIGRERRPVGVRVVREPRPAGPGRRSSSSTATRGRCSSV